MEENIPKYQCHKTVRALKIKGISLYGELGFENHAPMLMEKAWLDRHNPAVGGYLVVYEDGYQSYSPAEVFEAGYTSCAEVDRMAEEVRSAKDKLDGLTDQLFELVTSDDLSDEDLRDASEGLLTGLCDALREAGYGSITD